MPGSFSRNVNFNKWRAARYPDVMRRIKSHEPYDIAGFSWRVWDALTTLADVLDAVRELDAGNLSNLIAYARIGKKAMDETLQETTAEFLAEQEDTNAP